MEQHKKERLERKSKSTFRAFIRYRSSALTVWPHTLQKSPEKTIRYDANTWHKRKLREKVRNRATVPMLSALCSGPPFRRLIPHFHTAAEAAAASGESAPLPAAVSQARRIVQMPDEYLPPNKILFVQNLPDDTTKESLEALFRPYARRCYQCAGYGMCS